MPGESDFKTDGDQRCLLFCKIFCESALELTLRVPDILQVTTFFELTGGDSAPSEWFAFGSFLLLTVASCTS